MRVGSVAGRTVLLWFCACARICLAAAPDAKSSARGVELMIGATAGEAELLAPSIREMLAGKGLSVVSTRKPVVTAQDVAAAIAPPSEAAPSLARVLLDFTVSGQATLFLIDPPRGRVYVRRMALAHGLDAVARASVRFVIEQSIDAILEGREIGVSRDEFQRRGLPPPPVPVASAPAPAPPAAEARAPAAPVPAPTRSRMQLAAGYQGVVMGSGEFQHAAKVTVAARYERVVIAVAARVAAPLSIAGDGARAQLTTTSASASVAGRPVTFGGFSLLAGIGAGVDFTRVAPAVTAANLQPAAAFWAIAPTLSPFVALEWFFGNISIAVAGGVEVHPLDERYTVRTSTDTRQVFGPGRVRPQVEALVGIAF
jgi:hypothetical protein